MVELFKIKKNDTKPALAVTLQYSNGSPIDLSNSTVYFNMGNLTDYSAYTSGAATITGSTTGQVEYRWTGSIDTGSVGVYWGEFQVEWTGSTLTLPQDHDLKIQVYEDYN